MLDKTVRLPDDTEMTLFYVTNHEPSDFDHRCNELCVLQTGKSKTASKAHLDSYEKEKEKIAKKFAVDLLKGCADIAVVVTPPSASRQFAPFLAALQHESPELQVLDDAFTKSENFRAADKDTTFDDVKKHITASKPTSANREMKGVVCILDDIFGEGKTVAVVKSHIRTVFPNASLIVAACPLLVTPTPQMHNIPQ